MKPSISIIIPIHNGEGWLKRCFDSLCRQTRMDFEVLAVLDRCTDRSEDIVSTYTDRLNSLRIFRCDYGKPSATRNVGIDNATAQDIAFLDCDDYYLPHAIEKMTADIYSGILVTHKVLIQREGESVIGERDFFDNNAWLFGNTYKAEWLRQNNIRFNDRYFGFEDSDFHNQILERLCYENDNFSIRYNAENPFYVQVANRKSISHKKDFYKKSFVDFSTLWRYVNSGRHTPNYLYLANSRFVSQTFAICLCAVAGGILSGDFFRLVSESKKIRELLPPPDHNLYQTIRHTISQNTSEERKRSADFKEYRENQLKLFRKHFEQTIIKGWARSIDEVA